MKNEQPMEDKNVKNMTLQEYADLYCAGDRFHAIYELVDSDTAGSFDRHIDDLSQDEARFVLWLVRDSAVKAYGGERTFNRALKANTLAASLGVDIDNIRPETKNPFAKKLVLSTIGLFAAIAIAVLIGVVQTRLDVNLAYIGEIIIGLASLGVAGHVFQFLRFRKLKKLAASLPSSEQLKTKEYCPPLFEEAYAQFRQETAGQPAAEKA